MTVYINELDFTQHTLSFEMNRLVLLLVLAVSPSALGIDKFMGDKEVRDGCLKDAGLSADFFKEAKEDHSKFQSKEFKCFADCVGKKSGFFNDKGEVNMEKISERIKGSGLDEEKVTKIVEECKEENKDKAVECEKIPSTMFCAMKKFKDAKAKE